MLGEESLPLGLRSSCSLLSRCTFTRTHKQTSARLDPSTPASLAANHSAHPVLERGGQEGGDGQRGGNYVAATNKQTLERRAVIH